MTADRADGYDTLQVDGFEDSTLVTFRDAEGTVHALGAYDDTLADGLERVRAAHLGMALEAMGGTGEPSPEVMARAAVALHGASPGPTTLMRRMWAAHLGKPEPADEVFPAQAPDDGSDPEFIVGSLTVWPSGGRWLKCGERPVEITVGMRYSRGETDVDAQFGIEFYPVGCDIYLDPATWTEGEGLLYGDGDVEDEVNSLLASRGLGGHGVTWSEQGMQDPMVGNMDVDGRIALKLWPEMVAAEVADLAEANKAAPAP